MTKIRHLHDISVFGGKIGVKNGPLNTLLPLRKILNIFCVRNGKCTIQRKYIPDLAGASETAATLLSSLNKGGDKKGGSEAFFQNSAENFLASIIYFFVTFRPTGFRKGKKLKRFVEYEGQKLQVVIRNWTDYQAIDAKGKVILDFVNNKTDNVSTDADGMFVELDALVIRTCEARRLSSSVRGMRTTRDTRRSLTPSRASSPTCPMCCRSSDDLTLRYSIS